MRRTTLNAHRVRIFRVVDHVQAHLDDHLEPATAAQMSGLSPRQFQRVFLRVAGEKFKACVRRLRLERAARHLQTTRQSVLTVALDAGYESHEAFLRAFKKRFRVAPTEFRKPDRRGGRSLIHGSATETWQHIFATGLRTHVEAREPA